MTDSLAGNPIIVMGDFNCGPGSPPYREFTADRGNLAQLKDAHVLLGQDETLAGTFNGFRGDRSGPRIDMIFVNRRFEVLQAAIDRRSFLPFGAPVDSAGTTVLQANGDDREDRRRYPSDHFPVTAVVRLLSASDIPGM
jgi:endonuclease/exonuclease/phosphatase family metal-dependent hydrolase